MFESSTNENIQGYGKVSTFILIVSVSALKANKF